MPVRRKNTGAQMWVTHRVKNSGTVVVARSVGDPVMALGSQGAQHNHLCCEAVEQSRGELRECILG